MAGGRIYLVCNAHLDPVWLWEWEEGAAEAVSTFRIAADLCEEFGAFVFNHNEAILYQWVEEYEPALFTRIKRLVDRGAWHIMGGWYLQPDCNIPSGESLVRQALLGKRYFREKFGVEPTTAINFDPFGHSRGLVQIIAKSGSDSYLFCRPSEDFLSLESNQFIWVGYDGSEVLATRVPEGYNSPLGEARGKIEKHIQGKGDNPCTVVLWGVGNHGGGPSRQDLKAITDLIGERRDLEIIHSGPEAYFADLAKRRGALPRREGDLNPFAVGCYTSQVRIKQKHRLLENEMYMAEKMITSASVQGLTPYPAADLKQASHDLAMCEFHDILPGSSIQPVEEMSLRVLDHGLEIVSRLKARAFFALAAGQAKATDNEIPILVYNPHPFKVRTVVECEFQPAAQNWEDTFAITHVFKGGTLVPCQNEKEDSSINLDWRKRVAFVADLEPYCMNRFDCRSELLPKRPGPHPGLTTDRFVFATRDIEVVINTRTGLLDSYKASGIEYLSSGAGEAIVMADNEDPWGMTVRSFRNVAGRFTLMTPEAGARFSGVKAANLPSVRVVEDGPVRTIVEAVFAYSHSTICQRYMLPKEGTEMGIQTRVHWNEKDSMLKLSFPLKDNRGAYRGQTAYGVADLPAHGEEAVAQKWVAVVSEDGARALTCINDGTYGSDFSEDGLRVSLVRSPVYSGHPIKDRPIVPQDRYTPRIDQGERLFRFWLNAGPAEARLSVIDREALVKNEKPAALSFFPSGAGVLPRQLLIIDDDVIQVSAVKKAEENDDVIVRLFEPTGVKRSATLAMPVWGMTHRVELKPFEIKTLRIDAKKRSLSEVNLLER